jgi:preprotein translocase subunit SecE
MADKIKLILAVLAFIAGIWASIEFDTMPAVVRVLMVLGALAVAAVIGYQTPAGKSFWEFVKEARIELRKVVWPTNKETIQMTIVVFVMVVVVSLFLWAVDWGLGKVMRALTGTGA